MNKTEAISPKKIYLQVDPEGEKPDQWSDAGDVTWCADKINDNDVEYIRIDLSEQYAQQYHKEKLTNLITTWHRNGIIDYEAWEKFNHKNQQ